jgi:ribosomal protein S18 acetylase RimI-like enzyme
VIEYRQARLSDAQAIGLLHARSFRENVRGEFTDAFLDADLPAELLQLWQGRLDRPPENQFVQVALDDANLLGFVCAYGAHDSQWGSLIDNLHVVHSARKTGVGSSLMKQAGAWLTSRYSDMAVYLLVLESNSVARRFYERLGTRNAETSTMETHGGAVVRSCRYTWPRPQRKSAA